MKHHDHREQTTVSSQKATHDHLPQDEHIHAHPHASGWLGKIQEAIPFLHGHSHGEVTIDTALESNARGIWALKVSLVGLGVTALFQLIIVLLSGSIGLLADTIHNFSDAFTAIPLWIAFALARRPATRRYTYGYGRAEDVAGVIIVLMIFASSLVAGYESYLKFAHPEPLRYVWWVMGAAIVGFFGNEGVAIYRIQIGRKIGSAALIADGQHARIDGFTSLAVLFGAMGSLLGFPLADPTIGLLITLAILFIVKDTAVTMWRRLMDAVDPELVEMIERVTATVPGVQKVQQVRARWIGHTISAEVSVTMDETLSLRESHAVVEEIRHSLFHAQPRLAEVTVHVEPSEQESSAEGHRLTAHRHG